MSARSLFFIKHLVTSFLIVLLILIFILTIWYPSPLYKAVGVTHILLTMLIVDIIIGPLLGFLIYKEGKKSLKFDLSIIIILQISALIFGFYSISQGRPIWIAYAVDRFEVVRKNEIIFDNIDYAEPEFKKIPFLMPNWIGTAFAKDKQQSINEMFQSVSTGVSITQKPERYVPLEKVKSQIQQRAQVLSLLNEFNAKEDVNTIINKYPQADSWVPLKANAVDMVVLINKEKGEVVKIVDLRPWK